MPQWLLQPIINFFSKKVLDQVLRAIQAWIDKLLMRKQDKKDVVSAEEAIKESREAKDMKEQENAFKKTIDATRPK